MELRDDHEVIGGKQRDRSQSDIADSSNSEADQAEESDADSD